MNLYLVYTNIMSIYVLAESFDKVKDTVENFLNNEDYDWTKNREVIKIELIATDSVYPHDNNYKLILINNDGKVDDKMKFEEIRQEVNNIIKTAINENNKDTGVNDGVY